MRSVLGLFSAVAAVLSVAVEGSRLTPPVLPLTVRNPYFSTWLQDARSPPWERWPMFWTGEHIGLSIMASVVEENKVYPLLGRAYDSLRSNDRQSEYKTVFPTYLGAVYDASTTNMTFEIPAPSYSSDSEPVIITLSFLSPITPTSTLRQAIPASYLTISAVGNFDVDVYIDINGQWVSGDRRAKIEWGYEEISSSKGQRLKMFNFRKSDEALLTERRDRSEWGSMYFTGPQEASHQVGVSERLRNQFARFYKLRDTIDKRFRPIMDDEPVFAFSKTLHLNGSDEGDSVLYTMTHVQDPIVQYASARGLTFMRPLWAAYFPTVKELVKFHYADFSKAFALAETYSTKLAEDAFKSGAEDYVEILALTARQVMGATTFSGTPDNPILFLKEISSNGNFQTVDVIFPSFPFFLYTNPRWLAYLLEPLIEHMQSGQYPNDYTMHDLGTHFPNATGHPDGRDERMPVEECGNILTMGLAIVNSLLYETGSQAISPFASEGPEDFNAASYAKPFPLRVGRHNGFDLIDTKWGGATSDRGLKQARKWIQQSYPMWKQWTRYLVEYALVPEHQLSTDDFAGALALQTNLALKGILGIKAMAGLARIAGEDDDADYYEDIAQEYIGKWEEYAVSRDKTHTKLAYDWYGSWSTLYNLYSDSLLCFHLDGTEHSSVGGDDPQKPVRPPPKGKGFVPRRIYKMQSDWYHVVRQKYGLPLDQRHIYTKTDWEFFAMAVADKRTRSEILQSVAKWLNETSTDRPFTDLHQTEGTGGFPGPNFFARPVIGGHYAFLTLERACGGNAMQGLSFLEEETDPEMLAKVEKAAAEIMAAPEQVNPLHRPGAQEL